MDVCNPLVPRKEEKVCEKSNIKSDKQIDMGRRIGIETGEHGAGQEETQTTST
jgi:hypothetical protein